MRIYIRLWVKKKTIVLSVCYRIWYKKFCWKDVYWCSFFKTWMSENMTVVKKSKILTIKNRQCHINKRCGHRVMRDIFQYCVAIRTSSFSRCWGILPHSSFTTQMKVSFFCGGKLSNSNMSPKGIPYIFNGIHVREICWPVYAGLDIFGIKVILYKLFVITRCAIVHKTKLFADRTSKKLNMRNQGVFNVPSIGLKPLVKHIDMRIVIERDARTHHATWSHISISL